MKLYKSLKQRPQLLTQLTQQDVDNLLGRFTSTPPDDATVNGPLLTAFGILDDWKKGTVFQHLPFRQQDAETMIYLACELDWTDRAEALLKEVSDKDVSAASYEAVMGLLSKHKQQQRLDFWLKHLTEANVTLTRGMVRSIVLCHVATNQLDTAAHFLKRNHPGQDLAQLVTQHVMDDRELLDQALNVFAMDCMAKWRLNDMRWIYLRKRYLGMGTSVIIRNVVSKSLHTGHVYTAERMLSDTIYMQDIAGAQLCAKRLIQWYLSKKDINHGVRVWEQMEKRNLILPIDVVQSLLIQAAKLKYHVDTLRLYRRCKELYPIKGRGLNPESHVHVLRCMVRSKQFREAFQVLPDVEALVPDMRPNLARTAVRSMFSLCAQTGKVDLFERVFDMSERMDLSVTHEGLTSLIACYLSRGDVQSAKSAFQTVASHTDGPDVVDFNLLMRTVVMEDNNKVDYDKIFDILRHMKLVNVTPDETTMRTMLGFYESGSDMQNNLYQKLLLHPSASRSDHVFLNNIALTNLVRDTSVEHAAKVLMKNDRSALFPDQQRQPIQCNGLSFKILLDAATADTRYSVIAEKLYKDMRARGLKPNKDVYENLISCLTKKGKIAKARRYISKMEQETGFKADVKTYTKLVDGLIRMGKPHLAKEIILQDMASNEITFDSVVINRLKLIESKLSPIISTKSSSH
jgi:pentatricopeptide repeat protein